MQVHNLSGTRGPLRLQPWHRFCSLKKKFFFFKFTSCVSFVRAQETKLFAGECTLKPGKHCLVAFEKPHGEKSSSKYPYWWWGTVFILILAFTENTGTHTHTPSVCSGTFSSPVGFLGTQCFGMRFTATQDCCRPGKCPAKETERRGGEDHCGLPSCSLSKPK